MTRKILFLTLFAMLALPLMASAQGSPPPAQQPRCEVGPVRRTYGDTPWLVYSCDDDSSLVIGTTPDNPAAPFYFTLFVEDGRYHLHGEGTGSKAESAAAFKEIQSLTKQNILSLIVATRAEQAAPSVK